jgi:predicted metal-dependent phosphoesterase TrpH
MMKRYAFDIHLHTHHSYDSLLTPRNLVKTAQKAGLSAIVVTDHNTIRGGVSAITAARKLSIELSVFVGAEIKTEYGDVIGLFLIDEIKSRNYHDVIDEILAQDGIVYLPHPFANSTSVEKMDLNRIQVIEAFNGRNKINQNRAALKLAQKLNLPALGGSDAHLGHEVGSVKNITDGDITEEDVLRKMVLDNSSSILVKRMKSPVLPRFKMTQYMSWLRSGQSKRITKRVKLFLLRQARLAFSSST